MSRFFVGQRVRVIYRGDYYGRETVVTAVGVRGLDAGRRVFLDGVRVDLYHPDPFWGTTVYEPHDLEPILPDGHRACDEDFKRDLDRLLEGVQA